MVKNMKSYVILFIFKVFYSGKANKTPGLSECILFITIVPLHYK